MGPEVSSRLNDRFRSVTTSSLRFQVRLRSPVQRYCSCDTIIGRRSRVMFVHSRIG
jgi:hypothetical protein